MDDEDVLALYDWAPGICFQHPGRGTIATAHIKTIHPRTDGDRDIRACRDCVLAMEAMRRETAERTGSEYSPGHLGDALG